MRSISRLLKRPISRLNSFRNFKNFKRICWPRSSKNKICQTSRSLNLKIYHPRSKARLITRIRSELKKFNSLPVLIQRNPSDSRSAKKGHFNNQRLEIQANLATEKLESKMSQSLLRPLQSLSSAWNAARNSPTRGSNSVENAGQRETQTD